MQLPCPSCRGPMAVPEWFGGEVAGCRACGGLWLSNRASMSVARGTLPPAVVELAARVDQHVELARKGGYRSAAAPSARACPECGTALATALVTKERIEIDVCPTHGTWFDRYELRKITRGLAIEREERREASERQSLIDGRTRDELREGVEDELIMILFPF